MQYNSSFLYNAPNVSYNGSLIIKAPGFSIPIILNNVTIILGGQEDFSNYTTLAVMSIDINPTGDITIEVLDEQAYGLVSIESIAIIDATTIAYQ